MFLHVMFVVNSLQRELRTALLELGEVDNMIDDVVGSVQQLESDILNVDVSPGDPRSLHARINNVKVCVAITFCGYA